MSRTVQSLGGQPPVHQRIPTFRSNFDQGFDSLVWHDRNYPWNYINPQPDFTYSPRPPAEQLIINAEQQYYLYEEEITGSVSAWPNNRPWFMRDGKLVLSCIPLADAPQYNNVAWGTANNLAHQIVSATSNTVTVNGVNYYHPLAERNQFGLNRFMIDDHNLRIKSHFDGQFLGVNSVNNNGASENQTTGPTTHTLTLDGNLNNPGALAGQWINLYRQQKYLSGLVTTRGRFAQLYGSFHVRMRFPKGEGTFAAAWLWRNYLRISGSSYQTGDTSVEVDIGEALGHKTDIIYHNLHSPSNEPGSLQGFFAGEPALDHSNANEQQVGWTGGAIQQNQVKIDNVSDPDYYDPGSEMMDFIFEHYPPANPSAGIHSAGLVAGTIGNTARMFVKRDSWAAPRQVYEEYMTPNSHNGKLDAHVLQLNMAFNGQWGLARQVQDANKPRYVGPTPAPWEFEIEYFNVDQFLGAEAGGSGFPDVNGGYPNGFGPTPNDTTGNSGKGILTEENTNEGTVTNNEVPVFTGAALAEIGVNDYQLKIKADFTDGATILSHYLMPSDMTDGLDKAGNEGLDGKRWSIWYNSPDQTDVVKVVDGEGLVYNFVVDNVPDPTRKAYTGPNGESIRWDTVQVRGGFFRSMERMFVADRGDGQPGHVTNPISPGVLIGPNTYTEFDVDFSAMSMRGCRHSGWLMPWENQDTGLFVGDNNYDMDHRDEVEIDMWEYDVAEPDRMIMKVVGGEFIGDTPNGLVDLKDKMGNSFDMRDGVHTIGFYWKLDATDSKLVFLLDGVVTNIDRTRVPEVLYQVLLTVEGNSGVRDEDETDPKYVPADPPLVPKDAGLYTPANMYNDLDQVGTHKSVIKAWRSWCFDGGIIRSPRAPAIVDTGLPVLGNPTAGTDIFGATLNYSWTANGSAVTGWQIKVGSALGSNNYADSGVLASGITMINLGNLPRNDTQVHVEFSYQIAGVWTAINQTFTSRADIVTGNPPTINFPLTGAQVTGAAITYVWADNGSAVEKWRLLIGSTFGGSEYEDSLELDPTITNLTLGGLPENNTLVHMQLRYRIAGVWQQINSSFVSKADGFPSMITPTTGADVYGTSTTYLWRVDNVNPEEWQLKIGNTLGGNEYSDSGVLTGNTRQVALDGLPANNSIVNLELEYRVNGVWKFIRSTFISRGDTANVDYVYPPVDAEFLLGNWYVPFDDRPDGGKHYKLALKATQLIDDVT